MFYIVGTMALWQLFYKAFGDNLEEYHEILAMAMSSGYEKKEFPQEPPWSQATQVSATRSLNTLHREMGFVNLINSIYGSML